MAAPIALRSDFNAAALRSLAKHARDPDQTRRLLALAAIYDGHARSHAAQLAGVGLQIVRDWVMRFNDQGPDGLINRKAPGRTPILEAAKRAALRDIVEQGPIPALHGVLRWRLIALVPGVWDEFGLAVSAQRLSRELRAMNDRKLSARPRHYAHNAQRAEAFKKVPGRRGSALGPARRQANRDLVRGRGAGRAEDQDHPALGAAAVLPRRRTSGRLRSPSSGRSVRRWARVQALFCPGARARPWGGTWPRSRAVWRLGRMGLFWWTGPAGICRASWWCLRTSRFCCFRRGRRS
jgi:transposase